MLFIESKDIVHVQQDQAMTTTLKSKEGWHQYQEINPSEIRLIMLMGLSDQSHRSRANNPSEQRSKEKHF